MNTYLCENGRSSLCWDWGEQEERRLGVWDGSNPIQFVSGAFTVPIYLGLPSCLLAFLPSSGSFFCLLVVSYFHRLVFMLRADELEEGISGEIFDDYLNCSKELNIPVAAVSRH